jgi:hypothetical protein
VTTSGGFYISSTYSITADANRREPAMSWGMNTINQMWQLVLCHQMVPTITTQKRGGGSLVVRCRAITKYLNIRCICQNIVSIKSDTADTMQKLNQFPFLISTRINYPNLFCYKNLHVSGIFFAHHQGFSTVRLALVSFMQVLMTASKQSQDGTAVCP